MISNQILQSTLEGINSISKVDLAAFDMDGKLLASTYPGASKLEKSAADFAISQADSQSSGGFQYFKVFDEKHAEYVLVVTGESDEAHMLGKVVVFQLQSLLVAYKEKFDKDNFIKNLLLDNLLLVDIYNRAKKLHIETSTKRCVFIVECAKAGNNVLDVVTNLFGAKSRDFVTAVDEKNTIIVKDLSDENYDFDKIAKNILDALAAEHITDVSIAYGTVVNELKDVSKSYKEARMALDVGKIFYTDEKIIAYSKLGIGRLIYQLPLPLCKMFIKEIFEGKNPENFDEETLTTVNKFFENNLNVSETSRQLYIHRNTLVYRIDKLQKMTGMDLRTFDDAITFKIALMVGKYMKHMEKQDF